MYTNTYTKIMYAPPRLHSPTKQNLLSFALLLPSSTHRSSQGALLGEPRWLLWSMAGASRPVVRCHSRSRSSRAVQTARLLWAAAVAVPLSATHRWTHNTSGNLCRPQLRPHKETEGKTVLTADNLVNRTFSGCLRSVCFQCFLFQFSCMNVNTDVSLFNWECCMSSILITLQQ